MANQLHIYTNNPTAGKTDGTEASMDSGLTPVSVTLDASKAESMAVKCAIRCDAGFKIDGEATVSLKGTTAAKWKLAKDNAYAHGAAALTGASWLEKIALTDVATGNVVFWAKAMSSGSEKSRVASAPAFWMIGSCQIST